MEILQHISLTWNLFLSHITAWCRCSCWWTFFPCAVVVQGPSLLPSWALPFPKVSEFTAPRQKSKERIGETCTLSKPEKICTSLPFTFSRWVPVTWPHLEASVAPGKALLPATMRKVRHKYLWTIIHLCTHFPSGSSYFHTQNTLSASIRKSTPSPIQSLCLGPSLGSLVGVWCFPLGVGVSLVSQWPIVQLKFTFCKWKSGRYLADMVYNNKESFQEETNSKKPLPYQWKKCLALTVLLFLMISPVRSSP